MVRRTINILLLFLLAACNLSVPAATPTLAPTRTPSVTPPATNTPLPTLVAQVIPSDTVTATLTPSDTHTPTATDTPQPSATPSASATATHTNTPTATTTATASSTSTLTTTPSRTPTFTVTPSATNTNAPTATASNTALPTATPTVPPTFTPIPTVTPLPLLPTFTQTPSFTPSATNTNAPTATPTHTITPSFTPSNTLPPSPTPTRTLSPDEIAAFKTPAAVASQPTAAVFTQPPPLFTDAAPTQDVTAIFITAEAPITDLGIFTPIPFDTTPQAVLPTETLPPTVALVVPIPATLDAPPTLLPFSGGPQTLSFALTTSGGIAGTSFSLLDDTVLFERNPVDPNEYVTTDSSGILYITGVNGRGATRIDQSPFSEFTPFSREENNAFVSAARWSPNGQYVAFIVAGRKLANDGVWVYAPGQSPPQQLLVDCPSAGFPGCSIVSNPFDPNLWESRGLAWSPNSDAILVSVRLTEEGRAGLILLPLGQSYNTRPNVFRYDYGSWAVDGSRILVSGRSVDGHEYVGWINRDGSFSELVFDAEASGLWMGFAHQAFGGQIYALGAPGDRNGPGEPLRIYNMAGQPLSSPIGDAFPQRVEWSPDGTAVFVQANGRQYIASVDGNIREITGQVSGARAVNWVSGNLPPAASGNAPAPSIPSGVIAGSEYQAGQQLRVYSTELNVRSGPGIGYAFVRNPLTLNEYVVILAGPVDADGARWWQVQTADGVVGWIAGAIGGAATLGV